MSDITKFNTKRNVSDEDTDKQVGYLLGVVEGLSIRLDKHMEREEKHRNEDRLEVLKVKRMVENLSEEAIKEKDLKRFIVIVSLITGVLGLVLDKLDPATIVSLLRGIP